MISEIFKMMEIKFSNFLNGHQKGKINPSLEKDSWRSLTVQDSHREKSQYQLRVNR